MISSDRHLRVRVRVAQAGGQQFPKVAAVGRAAEGAHVVLILVQQVQGKAGGKSEGFVLGQVSLIGPQVKGIPQAASKV